MCESIFPGFKQLLDFSGPQSLMQRYPNSDPYGLHAHCPFREKKIILNKISKMQKGKMDI